MRKKARGFSLLEAIVALAIFATSTVSLYAWYSTSLIGLIRAEENAKSLEFITNLDAHFYSLNLQDERVGEFQDGEFVAQWEANLVESKKEGRTASGTLGYHRLGLYEVSVFLYRLDDDELISSFRTRLVGYEPVRMPSNGIGL